MRLPSDERTTKELVCTLSDTLRGLLQQQDIEEVMARCLTMAEAIDGDLKRIRDEEERLRRAAAYKRNWKSRWRKN